MRQTENFWDLMQDAEGPFWTERAKAVGKLAALYSEHVLSDTERLAAENLFRSIAQDGELIIRRLVAEWLKDAPWLPRDIALALAMDCPEVAGPVLERSPALDTQDLLQVLREHPGEHRAAIARRLSLAAEVVDALCRVGDEEAVATLLDNLDAKVPQRTLDWLLEARSAWRRVGAAAERRRDASPAFAS
jgi:uncharacterized protein (DUF2336 family)